MTFSRWIRVVRSEGSPMLIEKFTKISDFIRRIKLCFFLRSLFGFALGMKSKKEFLLLSFVGFTFSIDSPICFPPIFCTVQLCVLISAWILKLYGILCGFGVISSKLRSFLQKFYLNCSNMSFLVFYFCREINYFWAQSRANIYDFLPRRMIRR